MKEENEIDKTFTENIEPYIMQPSNKIWESIDNRLDKKEADKYRAIVFRLRLMLAVFIFLFIGFGAYFLLPVLPKENLSEKNNQTVIEQTPVVASLKDTDFPNKIDKEGNIVSEKKPKGDQSFFNSSTIRHNQQKAITSLQNISSNNGNNSTKNFVTPFNAKIKNKISEDVVSSNSAVDLNNNSHDTLNSNIANSIATCDSVYLGAKNQEKIAFDSIGRTVSIAFLSDSINTKNLPSEKNEALRRISFGAYFSPDLTKKYLIDANKNDNQTESEYDGKEIPDFSFNTGIFVGYDVNSKWALKTGATYAYLMQSIKPKTIYAKTGSDGQQHYQFNTSYGNAQIPNDASPAPKVGDSLKISSTSTQLLQFISLPVVAKYYFKQSKLSCYAQFGLSANFIIGERLLVENSGQLENISNLEGLKEYYTGGILGLGISYNASKKLSFIAEPTLRGSLTSVNKNNPIKSYPYSIGISLGLTWHL